MSILSGYSQLSKNTSPSSIARLGKNTKEQRIWGDKRVVLVIFVPLFLVMIRSSMTELMSEKAFVK